jgi:hypothetical protein
LLDPAVLSVSPFSHDRKKTFQPRDLWEWLVKFAIVLFTVDVGVRRIQIDRDEWLRAVRAVRRRLLFWEAPPRPAEAEESLAALLARRDQVRSRQATPVEPRPELFRPNTPVTEPLPESVSGSQKPPAEPPRPDGAPTAPAGPAPTTTSRLLEAKRRAQKRND